LDYLLTNTFFRIDNEDKLREKVQEALAVYNEYVKNTGEGDADGEGANPDEATKEAADTEATKA
jgi:polyadenylate-binding protein